MGRVGYFLLRTRTQHQTPRSWMPSIPVTTREAAADPGVQTHAAVAIGRGLLPINAGGFGLGFFKTMIALCTCTDRRERGYLMLVILSDINFSQLTHPPALPTHPHTQPPTMVGGGHEFSDICDARISITTTCLAMWKKFTCMCTIVTLEV